MGDQIAREHDPPSTDRDQRPLYELLSKNVNRLPFQTIPSDSLLSVYFNLKSTPEPKYVSQECKRVFQNGTCKSIANTALTKSHKILFEILCRLDCQELFHDTKISSHHLINHTELKIKRFVNATVGILDIWLKSDLTYIRVGSEIQRMALAIYSDIVFLAGVRINKYYFDFDLAWLGRYQRICSKKGINFSIAQTSFQPRKEKIIFSPTTTMLHIKENIDIASCQDISKFHEEDGSPISKKNDDDWEGSYLSDLLEAPPPPMKRLNPDDCNCKFNSYSTMSEQFCLNCAKTGGTTQYFYPSHSYFLRFHSMTNDNDTNK